MYALNAKAFMTDENVLLCAPTGAGKTNVALLTILRLMSQFRQVRPRGRGATEQ